MDQTEIPRADRKYFPKTPRRRLTRREIAFWVVMIALCYFTSKDLLFSETDRAYITVVALAPSEKIKFHFTISHSNFSFQIDIDERTAQDTIKLLSRNGGNSASRVLRE